MKNTHSINETNISGVENAFTLYSIGKIFCLTVFGFLLLMMASVSAQAQAPGAVDPTFVGGVMSPYTFDYDPDVKAIAIQPDGKHIIAGNFKWVNSSGRNYIARLNEDGSLDSTFATGVGFNSPIFTVGIQPNGKIIVGGVFNEFRNSNGTVISSWKIARLNADGTLDTSFNAGVVAGYAVNALVLQPDGKIIIGGDFTTVNGVSRVGVARLNSDGSLDTSFAPAPGTNVPGPITGVFSVAQQPDGKILIGGYFDTYNGVSRNGIARINSDGSLDTTFDVGTGIVNARVKAIALQPDGKILAGGFFTQFNGTPANNIVRLNPNGSRDAFLEGSNCNVNPIPSSNCNTTDIGQITVLNDGKILVSADGLRDAQTGISGSYLVRFNSNGSRDSSFSTPGTTGLTRASPAKHAIQADGKIITNTSRLVYQISSGSSASSNMLRFNANGSFDLAYAPLIGGGNALSTSVITDILREPDGKIMAVGGFTIANNIRSQSLARFNADGTLDTSFSGGTDSVGEVYKILRQPDGKYFIAGSFGRVNNVERANIARLNADGSLDTTFNQGAGVQDGYTFTAALQPDGKIIIGGSFLRYNNVTRNGIARLNADGTLDTTFNPGTGIPGGSVLSLALQPDGKIVIGGNFTSYNGTTRSKIARINADGSLDTTFNPGAGVGGSVYAIKLLSDGRILIGGQFESYDSVTRRNTVRLNANGALDTSFGTTNQQFIDQAISEMHVQTNGKIIIAGTFTSVGGQTRRGVARLNADGSLDTSFGSGMFGADPTHSAAFGVPAVGLAVDEASGRLYFGSSFSTFNNIGRGSLVRLFIGTTQTARTMFDFDGDGKADISVFRPSNGAWYLLQSQNGFTGMVFGLGTDKLVPGDYDGDGKTDIAVFREGIWYLQRSTLGFTGVAFGLADDIPVPGDYDGDGKTDIAVFRPSNGAWYLLQSSAGFTGMIFGLGTDKPVPADYDGDGKTDVAVNRNGTWYLLRSSLGFMGMVFGNSSDKLVPADYDGDGKADIAVFRPSNGTWYIQRSQLGFTGVAFGLGTDKPVPADYDGDGKADIAVFRGGIWYLLQSTAGFTGAVFGEATDKPIPHSFVP